MSACMEHNGVHTYERHLGLRENLFGRSAEAAEHSELLECSSFLIAMQYPLPLFLLSVFLASAVGVRLSKTLDHLRLIVLSWLVIVFLGLCIHNGGLAVRRLNEYGPELYEWIYDRLWTSVIWLPAQLAFNFVFLLIVPATFSFTLAKLLRGLSKVIRAVPLR